MNLEKIGVVPRRTANPKEAQQFIEEEGSAILTGLGLSAEEACEAAYAIFGDKVLAVPEAACVYDGGEMDSRPPGHSNETQSRCHTDGFSYGDKYPDYILLLCAKHSEVGGESFLVDGYSLVEEMETDPDLKWMPDALSKVRIDQTEPGMQVSTNTIIKTGPNGRKMLLMADETYQRPREDSEDPDRDQQMIRGWRQTVDDLANKITKFKLYPGEASIIDNYRLFHGREAYEDIERLMWRVWIWTDDCSFGLPDGLLHSDSRYARRRE
jgi:alpha-ketoglutarate-dependent taurine dioxygenase